MTKTRRHRIFQILLDVGDNPYIRRPPPIESPLFPQNHRLQLLDIIRAKQRNTIYDLTLNLMQILISETSDDLTL